MSKTSTVWILVADSGRARLLRGTRTGHDRPQLEELAAVTTSFVAGERERPTRTRLARGAGDVDHEHEERIAHFAREVAAWLGKQVAARGIEACALFAPGHLTGALRKQVPRPLADKLQEHVGELAQLSLPALLRHPRIAALLAATERPAARDATRDAPP